MSGSPSIFTNKNHLLPLPSSFSSAATLHYVRGMCCARVACRRICMHPTPASHFVANTPAAPAFLLFACAGIACVGSAAVLWRKNQGRLGCRRVDQSLHALTAATCARIHSRISHAAQAARDPLPCLRTRPCEDCCTCRVRNTSKHAGRFQVTHPLIQLLSNLNLFRRHDLQFNKNTCCCMAAHGPSPSTNHNLQKPRPCS